MPSRFEPEAGGFVSRGPNFLLTLSGSDFALVRAAAVDGRTSSIRMRLVHARREQIGEGVDPLPGRTHYLLGRDPHRWRTSVPQYARVRYQSVYPGIDVVYYGRDGRLEYDFVLAPFARPSDIRMAFEGVSGLRIERDGRLRLETAAGPIHLEVPSVYQDWERQRHKVSARYRLLGRNHVGFDVGTFDPTRPLVVDPAIVFATSLGGPGNDRGSSIAIDSAGQVYVAGTTQSSSFPVGPIRGAFAGGSEDAFVAKLDASGTSLAWLAYLGGTGRDDASSMAVDAGGNVIVVGWTDSPDFPNASAAQPTFLAGPRDAFVAKLSPDGSSLVYATYLGGTGWDEANAVALGAAGTAWVVGSTTSTDFNLKDPFQPNRGGGYDEAFVARMDAAGALLSSSYLGGSYSDSARAVAVDKYGSAYVVGGTNSRDFPLVGALPLTYPDYGSPAFLSKITPAGTSLAYSTYLGEGNRYYSGQDVAVDDAGSIHVAMHVSGQSPSSPWGQFLKIDATGTTILLSVEGSAPAAMAIDASGGIWSVANISVYGSIQWILPARIERWDATGRKVMSTELDSPGVSDIALDAAGAAYITGDASELTTVRPWQGAGGLSDAIVLEVDPASSQGFSVFDATAREESSSAVQLEVRLASSSSTPESVSWRTHERGVARLATAGQDYVASSGILTFPPGTISQTISVPILADTVFEQNESFRVMLFDSTAPLVRPSAVATISDAAAPTIRIDDAVVAEGAGTGAVFRVRVSPPPDRSIPVSAIATDVTTTAGSDYTASTTPPLFGMTLFPGQFDGSFFVPVIADGAVEGPETFVLDITAEYGYVVTPRVQGTILDPPAPSHAAMYRAYSRNGDYHFFTTDLLSKDFAVGALGYRDESDPIPFYVWNTLQSGSVPLYRMYNPNLGRHTYTTGSDARAFLTAAGMVYERDEGFVFPLGSSPPAGTTELFRLYNTNSGTHLFTVDAAQKGGILALFPNVWVQHTSVGYVFAGP